MEITPSRSANQSVTASMLTDLVDSASNQDLAGSVGFLSMINNVVNGLNPVYTIWCFDKLGPRQNGHRMAASNNEFI